MTLENQAAPPKESSKQSKKKFRNLTGHWFRIGQVVAVAFVVFHLYTAGMGPFPNLQQRAIHVGFALILAFILMPFKKTGVEGKKVPVYDMVLIALAIWGVSHIVMDYDWIMENPAESRPIDVFLGIVMILLVVEAGRRAVGILFPILTCCFIFYSWYGMIFPDPWRHPNYPIEGIIQVLYLSDIGMWGFVTGISANIVAIFIIFGSLLLFTGGGQTFIDFSLWSTGKYYGGPAKVATVASSLFGMVSGSAVANTAATGNFTIPMMKKLGYGEDFAAAVEATASSGGQLTPPIMGAGAFLMAEILSMSYLKVALSATVPALLFYTGIFSSIHFEAKKRKLGHIPLEEIPPIRTILAPAKCLSLIVPLVVLFANLFRGYTPTKAAFWACAAAIVIFMFSNFKARDIYSRFLVLINGVEAAGKSLVQVVALLVCANMIMSLINLTGVGIKVAEVILDISGNFQFFALLLTAAVALILGMGIPTTAAYLLTAAVVAPALTDMGIEPIAAHLFIFYYAVLSALTPPVCAGIYVAAGIAGSNWVKTAWIAIKLALVKYIVPFMFIYKPSLLFIGSIPDIAYSILTAIIGVVFIGTGTMGYFRDDLNLLRRTMLIAGSILLIMPGVSSDLIGLLLLLSALVPKTVFSRLKHA